MQRASNTEAVIAFLIAYFAIAAIAHALLPVADLRYFYWVGLAAVLAASIVGRYLLSEKPIPPVPTSKIGGALLLGVTTPLLILTAALTALRLAHSVRLEWLGRFSGTELLTLILPAILHEELLFRGFVFRVLSARNAFLAILTTSLLFASVHALNPIMSPMALIVIFLGGALLALLRLRSGTLLTPIVFHFVWNGFLGPILGDSLSGYHSASSLWRLHHLGKAWVDGGEVGLEGSIVVGALLTLSVALLARWRRPERDV